MAKEGVTINELSKMAQVTVRTIRFYTDEGVLDEPAGRDRFARYTLRHYLQLCAAKHLKERFLPLRVIRDQMASLNDQELERLAGPVPADIARRFAEADAVESLVEAHASISTKSARFSLKSENASGPLGLVTASFAEQADDDYSLPFDAMELYRAKSDVAPRRPVSSVGDVWHRIVISPSMELHVREDAMHEAGEIRRILASLRKAK